MQILFIHGMGRSPLSGIPLLWQLRKKGFATSSFGYSTALHNFESISTRLAQRISKIAEQGDYILIGHSLGGVLIRGALSRIPTGTQLPQQIFFLGVPVKSARMARHFENWRLFRWVTGDCGQLLASEKRMAELGSLAVRTTSIVGTRGIKGKFSPFRDEPNDGIVAKSEVQANWITEEIPVPLIHTLLPSSAQVAKILLSRLQP